MEDWRVGLSFSEWVISSREVWELVFNLVRDSLVLGCGSCEGSHRV